MLDSVRTVRVVRFRLSVLLRYIFRILWILRRFVRVVHSSGIVLGSLLVRPKIGLEAVYSSCLYVSLLSGHLAPITLLML